MAHMHVASYNASSIVFSRGTGAAEFLQARSCDRGASCQGEVPGIALKSSLNPCDPLRPQAPKP